MKSEKFHIVHDEPMLVGESAVWHAIESALYWVDIDGKSVHRLHPSSGLGDARQKGVGRCVSFPGSNEHAGIAGLPINGSLEEMIGLVGRDLVYREQFREAALAGRHIENQLMELAIRSAADAPFRFVVALLCAVEDQGDLVRNRAFLQLRQDGGEIGR